MTKRMLSMLLLMTLVLLPAAQASAAYTRYVYTENGRTLNVRDSQMIGENVVGAVRCGAAVNVIQEYGGWAEIEYSWRAADGTPRYSAYVMTRYLVDRPGSSSGSGSSGSGRDERGVCKRCHDLSLHRSGASGPGIRLGQSALGAVHAGGAHGHLPAGQGTDCAGGYEELVSGGRPGDGHDRVHQQQVCYPEVMLA